MKSLSIICITLFLSVACSPQKKVLKKVEKIASIDQAKQLQSKYPNQSEILRLDSVAFYSHPIYSGLRPGTIQRIGHGTSEEADIYKLIERSAQDTIFYILHIQFTGN